MAKHDYVRRDSILTPSDRSESPPPAYSPCPVGSSSSSRPSPSEQTPLLQTKIQIRQVHINIPRPSYTRIGEWFIVILVFVLFFGLLATFIYLIPTIFGFIKGIFVAPPPPIHAIAIIGAGPAGICAAQDLYHKANARGIHVNITIFESAPLIGGQLALNSSTGSQVFPYDDPTQDPIIAEDIAGTGLLWGNPLFSRTSEKTLGDKVQTSEAGSQRVSYFNGDRVIAQTTRPYTKTSFTDWAGLIFQYGSSVWSAGAMAKQGAELEDRLVDVPLVPDLAQLLISLGIYDYAKKSTGNELNDRGIAGGYVPEVLAPEVGRVYSQNVGDISALALMLASGIEDTANAYVGGELLDRLEMIVSAVGANVRESTEVHGVKYAQINEDESAWLVQYATPSGRLQAEAFDKVIIAAPNFDLYSAASAEDVEAASILTYRTAYVAFFTVPRRIDAYGYVNQVLFLENALGGVRELAFVKDIVRIDDDDSSTVEYLYRALADSDAVEQLEQLNLGITWWYQEKLENAYPYMYPSSRFPPFKLSDKGLWWTSAIHTIASTVDTSCLAGRIVAEQLINDLKR
ncbi:putative prenylcysteine oxidase 1 precursor protein [Daldinia childiae]|uniref:putative prenylcysteine oxidase 1 precursor protein n=1 Tax=Daldinia childiae TaxID=326645 RepID=UPI00144740D0|nr:putative prenylcysteine oxidase 1 precursor protein [Daldinia childiae]KAF3062205.1 putative prenylcysteine oxidase 1 precursor protein [Daldinia childiae]